MAKAKYYNDDPENEGTDTPDTSPNDNNNEGGQAGKAIDDYIDTILEVDTKDAKSSETVGCFDYQGGKNKAEILVCRLVDANAVYTEYSGIRHCVSVPLANQTEALATKADEVIKKSEELEKKWITARDAIAATKEQLQKVHEISCKLKRECEDSCNTEQLKALKGLKSKDGKLGVERFKAETESIGKTVADLFKKSDQLFKAGVGYAGIQAYMNIPSIKSRTDELKQLAADMHANVAGNADEVGKTVKERAEAVTAQSKEMATAIFARNGGKQSHRFLEKFKIELEGKIRDANCSDWENKLSKFETICKEVMETFNTNIDCAPGSSDSTGSNPKQNT